MGTVPADLFLTLDGVYQALGGPDEDRGGGFAYGGWQGNNFDEESGARIRPGIERLDAPVLGWKTYDIFAGYWPDHGEDDPVAAKITAVPKFVASRTLADPSWAGMTVLTEVATEVRALEGPVRGGPRHRQRRPPDNPAQGRPPRPAEPHSLSTGPGLGQAYAPYRPPSPW